MEEEIEAESDSSSMPYHIYRNVVEENQDGSETDGASSAMEIGRNTDTEVEYSINLWANWTKSYSWETD